MCIYVWVSVYVYLWEGMCVCVFMRGSGCMYIYVCMCIYERVCVWVFICGFVFVSVSWYIQKTVISSVSSHSLLFQRCKISSRTHPVHILIGQKFIFLMNCGYRLGVLCQSLRSVTITYTRLGVLCHSLRSVTNTYILGVLCHSPRSVTITYRVLCHSLRSVTNTYRLGVLCHWDLLPILIYLEYCVTEICYQYLYTWSIVSLTEICYHYL